MTDESANGLSKQRRTQAVLTARSIMLAYGSKKAMNRVREMSATREEQSSGNKAFYSLLETLIREAIEKGTIDGRPMR